MLDKPIINVYNDVGQMFQFLSPFHAQPCMEGLFFDPRFDYFVRRKESQNCEFGDCSFRADCAQPSIIKGLQVSSKPCLKKAYSRPEYFAGFCAA
jgi:hypothetical protein